MAIGDQGRKSAADVIGCGDTWRCTVTHSGHVDSVAACRVMNSHFKPRELTPLLRSSFCSSAGKFVRGSFQDAIIISALANSAAESSPGVDK